MTLDDIATWVYVNALHRVGDTDVQDVARQAARDFYLVLCDKIPFDELMVTSGELPLTINVASYAIGAAPLVFSPPLRSISNVRITFSASSSRRLRRSHVRLYDSQSVVAPGRPSTYARWGSRIEVNQPPDSGAYTVRFRYWSRPALLTPYYNTPLVIPDAWLELVRWESLFRAYYALDQIEKAMALVTPNPVPDQPGTTRTRRTIEPGIIPKLWNDLLSTVSQHENVDEDFSINPQIRAYSVR